MHLHLTMIILTIFLFAKGYGIKKYKLYIHNRWGELVFKTNNIEEGWDSKNGNEWCIYIPYRYY